MSKRKPVPRKVNAATKPANQFWSRPVIVAATLAVAAYANSLPNGFAADDKEQLLQNPVVAGHQIAAAFGSGVWAFRGAHTNYYRPLQFLVYILLHAVFGFQPLAFHLLFVLWHAGNTVLVYRLGLRLLDRPRAALAAALLFAVHPIHTEVVDWIASLPDLMLTTIVILGVWWFANQGASPRSRQIAGHCVIYFCALLTKETGVMLLPLYLAFERLYLRRPFAECIRNIKLYAAMLATLALYLATRSTALGGLAPGQQGFHQLTPWEFVLSVTVTAAQYIGRLIVPGDLNFFHIFHPTVAIDPSFLIALVVVVAIAVATFLPPTPAAVAFGVAWIALTLLPALNLTGVGQNVFAERYLYLPSVGFVWIAGLAWVCIAERQQHAALAAGIAVLCLFAWQTFARNRVWRDDYSLFQKTVAQSPESGIMHNNLAGVYVDRNEFDLALEEERKAVKYEPRSEPFHKNLGLLLLPKNPRDAVREFEEAQRLQPSDTSLRELLQEAHALAGN